MSSRTLLLVGAMMVAGFCAAAWAKDAPVLLEKGLHAEETAGDVDKAIGTYQQVIEQGEAERGQVAEARYRLGMCYLKKGEKEKAQEAFETLLKLYPDQTKLVEAAQAELAKLAPVVLYGRPGGLVGTYNAVGVSRAAPTTDFAFAGTVPVGVSGSLSAARLQLADVEAEAVALQAEVEAKHKALERGETYFKAGTLAGGDVALERAKKDLVIAEAQYRAALDKKKILTEEVARLTWAPEAFAAGRGPVGTRFLHGAKPLVGAIPAEMRAVLDKKVECSFDTNPLPGVVEYLQQVSGAQFVLFTKDLPDDQAPVTLTYQGTLEQGLNLICELTDLAWTVDGNVVKIGARERFEPLPSTAPIAPFVVPGGAGGFGAGAARVPTPAVRPGETTGAKK